MSIDIIIGYLEIGKFYYITMQQVKSKGQFKAQRNAKKALLNQIFKQSNLYAEQPFGKLAPQYFHSFSYTDHITNNILPLEQEIGSVLVREPEQCEIQLALNKQQQSDFHENYDISFGLMKSTKNFHINSIKQKNYKVTSRVAEHKNKQNYSQKQKISRYILRKKKEKQKYTKQKLQLSRILDSDKSYLYFSANISLTASPRTKKQEGQYQFLVQQKLKQKGQQSTKNQIPINQTKKQEQKIETTKLIKMDPTEEIVREYERSVLEEKHKRQRRNYNNYSKKNSQVLLNLSEMTEDQLQLINKIDRQLRRQITKNSEYLVNPSNFKVNLGQNKKCIKNIQFNSKNIAKELRNLDNCSCDRFPLQKQPKIFQNQNSQLYKQIQSCKFKIPCPCPSVPVPESASPLTVHLSPQQKSFLSQLKQNQYHKAQLSISNNPHLLHTKQPHTYNNPLHLCIIHNRPQIFSMIVKKCKENKINLLNLPNKYGRTAESLCRVYRAFGDKIDKVEGVHWSGGNAYKANGGVRVRK